MKRINYIKESILNILEQIKFDAGSPGAYGEKSSAIPGKLATTVSPQLRTRQDRIISVINKFNTGTGKFHGFVDKQVVNSPVASATKERLSSLATRLGVPFRPNTRPEMATELETTQSGAIPRTAMVKEPQSGEIAKIPTGTHTTVPPVSSERIEAARAANKKAVGVIAGYLGKQRTKDVARANLERYTKAVQADIET